MDSLYDIKDYQDYAKPSDSMGENDYVQDVFLQTRPDVFDNSDNPYYKFPLEQNDVTDKEFNDFNHTQGPKEYDRQLPPLVNPYKKIKDIRSHKVAEIISEYRVNNDPIVLAYNELTNERGYSFYKLLQETSNFSKKHSPICTVSKLREDTKNRTWSFVVRGHKKDSNPRGHVVFVRLGKDPKEKNIQKLQVHVACSCPFWKYWGPDYNANSNDYLEGKPRSDGSAPDERDPGRQNKICKHVYAVGKIFDHFAKSKDLDTYKDVGNILEELDKTIDPVKMEDISALKDTLLLDRSEIKEIEPILNKYKKEQDPKRREKIKQEALKSVEDILQNKDKSILQKIQTGLKSLYQKIKEKIFKKKSSVDNVLEMYMERNETGEI